MTASIKTKQTATARAAKTATKSPQAEPAATYMFDGFELPAAPSSTRLLVSAVAQLVSFGLSFYWGVQALGWLMAASLAATSSAFIGLVLLFLGAYLTFVAAWRTGRIAEDIVLNWRFDSIADIGRDIRIGAAKKMSLVRGWFTPSDRIEVEPAR